jgi:hypothetical protein
MLEMQAQSDHVERSDLAKRFFIVRWWRGSQEREAGKGMG